jgi:hypothetical protein
MKFRDFVIGVFCDNGMPSFSRVATGLALAFACGWVTSLVRFNHALPDLIQLTMFVGALYGVNRFSQQKQADGGSSFTVESTKTEVKVEPKGE